MKKNTQDILTKVLLFVFALAVVMLIVYPKLKSPSAGVQPGTGSPVTASKPAKHGMATVTSNRAIDRKRSPAEESLIVAQKSGKPTMILFHSET